VKAGVRARKGVGVWCGAGGGVPDAWKEWGGERSSRGAAEK